MLKSKLFQIVFTIFVFNTISCKSQDKIDLKGSNWTNCSQKTFDNQYVETFFDQDFYHFYDENFGLRVGGNFSFENGNFYIKTISADEFIFYIEPNEYGFEIYKVTGPKVFFRNIFTKLGELVSNIYSGDPNPFMVVFKGYYKFSYNHQLSR